MAETKPTYEGKECRYKIADDVREYIKQHGGGKFLTEHFRKLMAFEAMNNNNKTMQYKVLYTPPTIKGESSEVTFQSIGETKQVGNYTVTLKKVLTEPTTERTGSALVEKVSEFGKVSSETCTIAKIK